MSRTVSARIPKELHEELRERCNKVGCSINDYLKASIEFGLTGHTEFDFGDEEEDEEPDEIFPPESEPPELKPHHDPHGNYWTYDENSKKWTCHISVKNIINKP